MARISNGYGITGTMEIVVRWVESVCSFQVCSITHVNKTNRTGRAIKSNDYAFKTKPFARCVGAVSCQLWNGGNTAVLKNDGTTQAKRGLSSKCDLSNMLKH